MQDGELVPTKGASSTFGRGLRESMATGSVSTTKLAEAYRDLLVRDRDLKRDKRNFNADYYKLTGSKSDSLPTRLFARWCRNESPSVPTAVVAWRVFESLAKLGISVTGFDGLIAAGYGRETIVLIGTILGRWHKDRWDKLPDSDAVRCGLGLIAAKAAGFTRLTEFPNEYREIVESFPDDDESGEFSIASVLYQIHHSESESLEMIAEQEEVNDASLSALSMYSDRMTEAWWKWREQAYTIEDMLPEYYAASLAMKLKHDGALQGAREILAGARFGVFYAPEKGLVGTRLFPDFSRINQQMREYPAITRRVGYAQ